MSSGTSTKTWFDQYNEFADACSLEKGDILDRPNFPAVALAQRLVEEEWEAETKEALARYLAHPSLENLVPLADGIGDTIYVLCQLARALGLPLNLVWDCIHSANMTKVGPDGKVRRREDGKILKPEGFVPPDQKIYEALFNFSNDECVRQGRMGADNWP